MTTELNKDEQIGLEKIFSHLKKLNHVLPYKLIFTKVSGDLLFIDNSTIISSLSESIHPNVNGAKEINGSISYSLKSVNGCKVEYEIQQLGKLITE